MENRTKRKCAQTNTYYNYILKFCLISDIAEAISDCERKTEKK